MLCRFNAWGLRDIPWRLSPSTRQPKSDRKQVDEVLNHILHSTVHLKSLEFVAESSDSVPCFMEQAQGTVTNPTIKTKYLYIFRFQSYIRYEEMNTEPTAIFQTLPVMTIHSEKSPEMNT